MQTIRVLIVDDSARMRRLLTKILETDPRIEVCGTACDPYDARSKIKRLKPDVLTLDFEMPKMDGITFLRNLMRLHPMPVIMVSDFTNNHHEIGQQALLLGALDTMDKPGDNYEQCPDIYNKEIITRIITAAGERVSAVDLRQLPSLRNSYLHPADAMMKNTEHCRYPDRLIAIGASTGGTEAICNILQKLPATAAGVVIAQHISIPFSTHFARRLNSVSDLAVCEATHGQRILPGNAYVAPGNMHLMVVGDGKSYYCKLDDGPAVNRHIPSVDVLFRSVAGTAGARAIGVLLTGMGKDGAQGMKEMQGAGAYTIAQDEKSSVVWGMPGEAVKLGIVDSILPLDRIADEVMSLLETHDHPARKILP